MLLDLYKSIQLYRYRISYLFLLVVFGIVGLCFCIMLLQNRDHHSSNMNAQPYKQIIDAMHNVSAISHRNDTSVNAVVDVEHQPQRWQFNFNLNNSLSTLAFVFRRPTVTATQSDATVSATMASDSEPVVDTDAPTIQSLLDRIQSLEAKQSIAKQQKFDANVAGYRSQVMLVKSVAGTRSALVRLKLDELDNQTEYWVSEGDWIGNCLVNAIDIRLKTLLCQPYNHSLLNSNEGRLNTIELVLGHWRQW